MAQIFPNGPTVLYAEDEYEKSDSRAKKIITALRFGDLPGDRPSDEIKVYVTIRLHESDKKMDGQLSFTPEQAKQLGLFLLNRAESQSKKEAAA